ncbi:MAG TPA: hypothetical protein ENK55_05590 [Actinobacteria bacterium]|nr:hypothetical protein [Actinomycetota bacterium]
MRRRIAVFVYALLVLVLPAVPAIGHGFGLSANPDHPVADSFFHTYVSVEANEYHEGLMEGVFISRMEDQYGARTDMAAYRLSSYDSTVDAYWYATPVTYGVADATCMDLDTAPNPDQCRRTRIRFEEAWLESASLNQRRQGACHEIGHSVGFDDSVPEHQTGCMSNGPNGTLSSHEIGHINAQW